VVAAEQHLIEGTARSPVQVLIYENKILKACEKK